MPISKKKTPLDNQSSLVSAWFATFQLFRSGFSNCIIVDELQLAFQYNRI
jgi:hypothetical protein